MSQPMPTDRPRRVRLTMLNSMAGRDLPEALDRHVQWGLEVMDLKDCLFGKAVMDLSDVQNLWQMGTFPTMHVYQHLAGLVGYLHLKGGQCDEGDSERTLRWRSSLAEASWPVAEITCRAVADGVCPVICLNPSHGRSRQEGQWEDFTKDDLDFIRESVPEIDP